jgi:hypothetical protein
MTDGQPWLDWVFTPNDVNVGSADGREPDLNHGFARSGLGNGFLFEAKLALCTKHHGLHQAARRLPDFPLLQL